MTFRFFFLLQGSTEYPNIVKLISLTIEAVKDQQF